MGCDIHIVLEKRFAGDTEWVGQWLSDSIPGSTLTCAKRNYFLFSQFGVRGSVDDCKIWPRNIPRDVSRLAWLSYIKNPTDHHSPSWCSPKEFADIYVGLIPDETVRKEFAIHDLFQIDPDDGAEWRIVFWFDN